MKVNYLLKMWLLLIPIAISFNGCKQNINHTNNHLTEMMLDQITLSSTVYNSLFFPDSLKKPVLIYRYSEIMCNGCIFEDLENLKDFQKKIGKDNVLILSTFSNNRQNQVRMHYDLADFHYRNISSDLLVIPVHETEGAKQYFAVIDRNGKHEMVFFPKKGYPSITQAYFEEVKKRLK